MHPSSTRNLLQCICITRALQSQVNSLNGSATFSPVVTSCQSSAGESELALAAAWAVPWPGKQTVDVAVVHEALVDDADLLAGIHLALCRPSTKEHEQPGRQFIIWKAVKC